MNICLYYQKSHDHLYFLKELFKCLYKNICYTNKNPDIIVITDKYLYSDNISHIKQICDSKKIQNRKLYFYCTEIVDYLNESISYYDYLKYNNDFSIKLKNVENVCDLVFTKSYYSPFKNIKQLYIPEYFIYENYNLSLQEFK
jgi:hypothetical protein